MKKLLSIVLAVSMIMSLVVCVPVSADTLPGNIATDYAPDYDVSKYTGNFVNTPWTPSANGNRWNVGGNGPEVDVGASRGEGWYEFMATRNVGNPLAGADGTLNYQGTPLSGTNVSFTKPANGTKGNVVFSFDVTIDSNNPDYGEQKVQIARRLNGGKEEKGQEYPVEYPGVDKGFKLTKDKIEKFQGTFTQVGDTDNANYGAYSVGLPMGSLSGARFEIKGENAYIGFEYPYDIEVVADVTASFPGGSVDVDANILNQIGKDGDFDDSVTWYVTSADRTEAAEGFTVVDGENGKAKIYADTTVEEGTYVVVAVSDNNADFVKGIEIEIGANPYSDYEPGERTGNLIPSTWAPSMNYNQHNASGSGSEAGVDWIEADEGYRIMATRKLGHPRALYNSDYTPTGEYNYHGASLSGSPVGYTAPATAQTGNVVFSFQVKTNSTNEAYGTQKIQVGRRNYSFETTVSKCNEYPVEFPGADGGFPVTTEYQTFSGTFVHHEGMSSADIKGYSIGLPMGTASGARVFVKAENAYLGYEYIYDLDATASAETITIGEEVEVEATVLNQIGKAYSGSTDTITWKAMNTSRTEEIDGITIEDGVVTVDETVVPGMYDIVAVYGNAEMVKGVSIEVKANPYSDFVPGEITGNLIPASWVPSMNYNQHNSSGSGSEAGVDWIAADEGYRIMATRNLGHPRAVYSTDGNYTVTGYNYHGASLSGSAVGYTAPATAQTGNVVFSFQVKTNSTNEAYGTQKIQVGRRNYSFETTDSKCNEYPVEFPGADGGFPVTTEYQTFSGTFVHHEGMSSADIKGYSIGLPMGTLASARVFVKTEGAYLGYEYAYDLEVEASSETVAQGETVAVEAKVLNQIGKEFAGEKEAITWKAMNTARTAFVDGITVVDGVATVADTVAPGTYDIVALYGDKLMAKGVSIEVTEAEDVIEGITISATAGGITVSTDTALSDAQLIFVTYENGKMVSVNNATKVTLDAQDTQEYSIPAGFANAKVMLFTADFKPLANVLN